MCTCVPIYFVLCTIELLKGIVLFVCKIVLAVDQKFTKKIKITRTIYSDSDKSEQFLIQNTF